MGSLSNAASLAQDTTFRSMTLSALVYQARQVAAEDPATTGHQRRMLYAQAIINNPTQYLDSISWTIAADNSIASLGSTAADVPEATLLQAVETAWDYLAGLYNLASA